MIEIKIKIKIIFLNRWRKNWQTGSGPAVLVVPA
jgi:hypothetical protein